MDLTKEELDWMRARVARGEHIPAPYVGLLLTRLAELSPPIPDDRTEHPSDWYCPGCDARLSGGRVTYEERCDWCGSALLILYEFGVEIEGQWYRPPTKENDQ